MNKIGYRAVRMGDWKYIGYIDQKGMDELYDLRSDPYELKNRINDSSATAMLESLQAELGRILVSNWRRLTCSVASEALTPSGEPCSFWTSH